MYAAQSGLIGRHTLLSTAVKRIYKDSAGLYFRCSKIERQGEQPRLRGKALNGPVRPQSKRPVDFSHQVCPPPLPGGEQCSFSFYFQAAKGEFFVIKACLVALAVDADALAGEERGYGGWVINVESRVVLGASVPV